MNELNVAKLNKGKGKGIPKGWVARSLETLLWLPEKCHKLSLVDLVRFFIQELMSASRLLVTMQTCLITPHRAPQVRVAHGKKAMDLCTITTSSIDHNQLLNAFDGRLENLLQMPLIDLGVWPASSRPTLGAFFFTEHHGVSGALHRWCPKPHPLA